MNKIGIIIFHTIFRSSPETVNEVLTLQNQNLIINNLLNSKFRTVTPVRHHRRQAGGPGAVPGGAAGGEADDSFT